MKPEEIKSVTLFPKDFFEKEGLEDRIIQEFKAFQAIIQKKERDKFQDSLNAFYVICMQMLTHRKLVYLVKINMYETLSLYSSIYHSEQTYINVIREIENAEVKQHLFTLYPYRGRFVYAEALFSLYGIENEKNKGKYTAKRTERLLKCKYHLLKIYNNHIDRKRLLTEPQLERLLVLLSGCLSQLSRWFEPMYYLNKLNPSETKNPNVNYMKALNLEAIKDKTCIDYNGILLLQIIDCCINVKKNQKAHPEQISQLTRLEKDCRDFLRSNNQKLSELRAHKKEFSAVPEALNEYKRFCFNKQLFINEHSLFCSCSFGIQDNLITKTNHLHTQTEWVDPFNDFLDSMIFDFSTARHLFYRSLPNSSLKGFYSSLVSKNNSKQKIKDSLLKNGFKMCYSILDQICYGIFKVLEIDLEKKLKEISKKTEKPAPKIYFLNMWDYSLIPNKRFVDNYYLISLSSISKDLDKYSALKDFKEIRNSLEHKILFVEDEIDETNPNSISRNELIEKTELLLMMTKSAIYSFNNLIRRESRIHEKEKQELT